ncbi:multiubiquitin domain-containing protein [Acidiferrobacter sp.]|uniref:multiubiquitin domain-containing protein n=1 Tax=Acidiferrobacter sp. TaxID=1872107 RepID=UPI002630B391|nr:multiubiquitin domain-containing protein [Acidiferrobacter sp.]
MTADASSTAGTDHEMIKVSGFSLTFHDVEISSEMPSGAQISLAAGFKPEYESTILKILSNGELEEIRPDEVVALCDSTRKFVIVKGDRGYELTINRVRFDWPWRVISGGQLRKLGQVSAKMEIYLDLPDHVERVIHEHDLVDLDPPGVEAFKTRQLQWELNVQGVILAVHEPTIVVRQAIKDAGFDPNKDWIIILRVRGEPKREVDLDFVVDLRTPGIEKLRLTPKEVNNGEAPSVPCRQFDLLEIDERFLNGLGLFWETIVDNTVANQSRRWLLIHNYPVPAGFTVDHALLALEIPLTYPGAQIDMFYTSPPLALTSGRAIDRTQVSATLLGAPFNGWSRHRGAQSRWSPVSDNVSTHLALVESAMAKETGE